MLIPVMALVFVLCGIGLVCWVEWSSSKPPVPHDNHSLDCMDWSRRGLIDPHCTAAHTTDHFARIRAQVNLTNTLDSQLGFRHE